VRGRLAAPLVALTGLAACACATAGAVTSTVGDSPPALNGIYQTRVDSEFQSGALNGGWKLRLDDGAYTFNHTGRSAKNVIISGVYKVAGRRITFKDRSAACSAKPGSGGCRYLGCAHPGTYTFTRTREGLSFAKLRDPNTDCELPVVLLSGGFHRVA